MKFDKSYTEYWEKTVNKSIDGTKIAGLNEAMYFLGFMDIKAGEKVLDMGCNFGRMYDALKNFTDSVYGVDPDHSAIQKASLKPYMHLRVGTAEQTGFESDIFDYIFCWAVFDVVDHIAGLKEMNRLLRFGGKAMISGKNDQYHRDDLLALTAEKNAHNKNFPNKFTNLKRLRLSMGLFGFQINHLWIFPRRGDFGNLKFIEGVGGSDELNQFGYEYLMIIEKIGIQSNLNLHQLNLDSKFSSTAIELSRDKGFLSPGDFFKS